MTRIITISFAFVFVIGCFAVAFAKPNFTGSWVMDRERSFGLPGNMNQTMTVKQTETQIEVETKLIQPGNERTVNDIYVLDGKEYEFSPPVPPNAKPDAPKPQGKRTSNWLPSGEGMIATEVITNQTDKGPTTTQVTKKWTFTTDGELIINFFIDGADYAYETKRIFARKKD
jgi:hypothetical protein